MPTETSTPFKPGDIVVYHNEDNLCGTNSSKAMYYVTSLEADHTCSLTKLTPDGVLLTHLGSSSGELISNFHAISAAEFMRIVAYNKVLMESRKPYPEFYVHRKPQPECKEISMSEHILPPAPGPNFIKEGSSKITSEPPKKLLPPPQ